MDLRLPARPEPRHGAFLYKTEAEGLHFFPSFNKTDSQTPFSRIQGDHVFVKIHGYRLLKQKLSQKATDFGVKDMANLFIPKPSYNYDNPDDLDNFRSTLLNPKRYPFVRAVKCREQDKERDMVV